MVWEITRDWEGYWDSWKNGKFSELQTKDMEDLSTTNFKKLNKLSRELKVSHVLFVCILNTSEKIMCEIFPEEGL